MGLNDCRERPSEEPAKNRDYQQRARFCIRDRETQQEKEKVRNNTYTHSLGSITSGLVGTAAGAGIME